MKILINLFVALIILFTVASCSSTQPVVEPTRELMPVTIQLSWIHEYSSSVFHSAVRNGYFVEQGIEPTLLEAGFTDTGFIDPIQAVLNGEAQFAMSDSTSLIQARAAGQPVIAVASILQRSPLAIITLADAEIIRPQDLVGHTVSVADGGARAVYNTLLVAQNIDSDSVNTMERTSFGIEPLINGEVDALVAWIINEGVSVQEQGYDPQYILMSDYGVDIYDFVLFTTETMIEENPDVVRGVVSAVRSGIQDVVDDPAQAIEKTLTFNNDLVQEEQLRRLEATIPLINVPGKQLGGMDAEVWQFTLNFLMQQGILEERVNIEEVYTLDFLPKDED